MTNRRDRDNNPDKPAAEIARGGLRLIKTEVEPTAAELAAAEALKNAPKNKFAKFMTSYADAIDREIQAILDL